MPEYMKKQIIGEHGVLEDIGLTILLHSNPVFDHVRDVVHNHLPQDNG
jgi:hypothetical protein